MKKKKSKETKNICQVYERTNSQNAKSSYNTV